jgi:hypothetical protein
MGRIIALVGEGGKPWLGERVDGNGSPEDVHWDLWSMNGRGGEG